MTRFKIGVASLLLLSACALSIRAGESVPKTPWECRQRVLEEIQRFRKQKKPDNFGGGDEHIQKVIARHFHELKAESTLILAWSGDQNAAQDLIRDYGLDKPNLQRWIDDRHGHLTGPWYREMFDLAQVMDLHRPDLAKKMRAEMRRLADLQSSDAHAKPNFDRMSLKELKQAARDGEEEAMLRWAALDRDEATPFLVQRMQDKNRNLYEQWRAAQALAINGDARGLAFLRQEILTPANTRGCQGASLLRAGAAGQKIFFELVKGYEKKKEEFPWGLSDAPLVLDRELYCKLLPQLVEIKDKRFRYNLDSRITSFRLPAATLSYLIDVSRTDDRKDSYLIDYLCRSLAWYGWEDLQARDVAHLWADEMLGAEDKRIWDQGAGLFLFPGLGSKERATTSARRQLGKSTELAVRILAEAGRAEDTLLIWEATHGKSKEERWNWYDRPSLGWKATIRLTNHLTAPR